MKSIVIFAVCLAAGCGGNGRPEAAKVTGRVTLPNGSPLPGGRIDFRAASGDMVSGQIKADGTYEASVPPGSSKVSIENVQLKGIGPAPRGLPAMPTPAGGDGQKYVPLNPRYAKPETSGLTTTVAGKAHTYDVHLR
jgi:hypothetical protein